MVWRNIESDYREQERSADKSSVEQTIRRISIGFVPPMKYTVYTACCVGYTV